MKNIKTIIEETYEHIRILEAELSKAKIEETHTLDCYQSAMARLIRAEEIYDVIGNFTAEIELTEAEAKYNEADEAHRKAFDKVEAIQDSIEGLMIVIRSLAKI